MIGLIRNLDNIKSITFKKSKIGGYKPLDVDAFIDDVYDFCKMLQKDNSELIERVHDLEHKLGKYREEESSIRKAVLGAQKFADVSMADADCKSKTIIFNASQKADEIVREAREEADRQKKTAWEINIKSEAFRQELMKLYEGRLSELRAEIENNEFFKKSEKEIREKINLGSEEESKDKKNILEVKFNKQNGPEHNEPSVEDNVQKVEIMEDIDSGICKEKRKLDNLRFGAKYRVSSREFGKGLYSGLFKRKK